MRSRLLPIFALTLGGACGGERPPVASPAPVVASAAPTVAPSASAPPPIDESFRMAPPADAPRTPFAAPAAVYGELHNHIPVVFVAHSSPYVAIRVLAAGGLDDMPNDVDVVGRMAVAMTLETTDRSGSELDDAYESLGMPEPETKVYWDAVGLSIVAPAASMAKAFELAADLVEHPAFDAKAIARISEQGARVRETQKRDAPTLADRTLRRALFGGHAYGGGAGTPAQVRAVTRPKVVALHAKVFDASRLSIVVAGGVDQADVTAALETAFGPLRRRSSTHVTTALPVAPATRARLVVVDDPGATLASVAVGTRGPGMNAPDADAAALAIDVFANAVFGRLEKRLVEELKYLPWVGPTNWQGQVGGLLGWRSRGATEKIAPALGEADHLLRDYVVKGPPEDDFADRRDRELSAFASSFETAVGVADAFTDALVLREPASHIGQFSQRIESVTLDAVKAAGARYLDADKMRTVVVGDWASLKEPLLALGWGPIEIRDADGKLVRMEGAPGAKH